MNIFENSYERFKRRKAQKARKTLNKQCIAWGHSYRNIYCSNPECPSKGTPHV